MPKIGRMIQEFCLIQTIVTFRVFIPIFTIGTQLFAGSFKLFASVIQNHESLYFVYSRVHNSTYDRRYMK